MPNNSLKEVLALLQTVVCFPPFNLADFILFFNLEQILKWLAVNYIVFYRLHLTIYEKLIK